MSFVIVPLFTAFFAWFIAWFFVKAIFMSWNKQLSQQIQSIQVDKLITPTSFDTQFESSLPLIETQLDHFFKHKLAEKMPMIAMFIGDQTIQQLKTVFIEELKLVFPSILGNLAKGTQLQLAQNIQQKWKPLLEPFLLKATQPYRRIAFVLGFVWGMLMVLLIQHI